MRCFLACFSTFNHSKRLNALPNNHSTHISADSLPLQSNTVKIPITEPIVKKLDEQPSCNGETKVTSFNFSEKNGCVLPTEKAVIDVVGKNEEKSNESKPVSDLISSKEASAALNPNSKGASEDFDFRSDGDLQESSESLFSLSIDSRKHTNGGEVGEKEVSSPMPKPGSFAQQLDSIRSSDNSTQITQTQSVLNLPHLKTAKATPTSNLTLHSQDKENINLDTSSFELLCKKEKSNNRPKKLVSEVDASLSSWLVEPETTPLSKGNGRDSSSPCTAEGRHILGDLTVNQSKNTPNLGTVESYWRHTGRAVDSNSSSSILAKEEPVNKYAKVVV